MDYRLLQFELAQYEVCEEGRERNGKKLKQDLFKWIQIKQLQLSVVWES